MSRYQQMVFETNPHGNSIFCIPALPKAIVTKTDEPALKSFELGRALESYYPLLELVFEFLETKDLQNAKQVNPIWLKLAERELQKRISPTWISFCYDPSLCLRISPGFKYNNMAICVIVYNPGTIKLEKYICLHDSPNFSRMTFAEYIAKEVVPAGVEYCTIACSEVPTICDGRYDHRSQLLCKALIKTKCRTSIYQAMFIPFIPKIRTVMFHCSPKQVDQPKNIINDNERVRSVLIFSQKYRVRVVDSFLLGLLKGQRPQSVAMGGGLIRSTKTFTNKPIQKVFRTEDLFCIAFLEEEGAGADFNAYSIVINSESVGGNQYKVFEEEVVKLKTAAILRRCGIMFRFCCFAKFCKARETAIIAKHFPKYALLGLEVDGEIGWSTSNLQDQQEPDLKSEESPNTKKFKIGLPQTLHGWSTVLVLVTWGKKV